MTAQIDEIENAIAEMKSQNGERFSIKQMEKTRKGLEARLEKLRATDRKDDVITFEQLGVDRLFVDEAHASRTCSSTQNAQCCGLVHIGSAEIFGYVYEVPIYGRADRRARHHFCDRHPGQQQHDGALHHDAVSPVRHVAAERADPFRQLGFYLW